MTRDEIITLLKDPSVTIPDALVEEALIKCIGEFPEKFLSVNPHMAFAMYNTKSQYNWSFQTTASKYIQPAREDEVKMVAQNYLSVLAGRNEEGIDKILKKCQNVLGLDHKNFVRIYNISSEPLNTAINRITPDVSINIDYIADGIDVDSLDDSVLRIAVSGSRAPSKRRNLDESLWNSSWNTLGSIMLRSNKIMMMGDELSFAVKHVFQQIDPTGKENHVAHINIINRLLETNHPTVTDLMRSVNITNLTCRKCFHTATSKSGYTLHAKIH